MARLFVLTLAPIAIAYRLAHYATFFALAGQLLIPLASDPMGRGWDLFGTAHGHVGVISARFVWYTALVTIVVGHVIAVILAHVQARRIFEDNRSVLMSQIPMLVLMVGYTMSSLWILAAGGENPGAGLIQWPSGLLDLDQGAAEVLGV